MNETGKVIVFGHREDDLVDLINRLHRGYYHVVWIPVAEWSQHIGDMDACCAVILDEVNPQVKGQDATTELEEWLTETPRPFGILVLEQDSDWHFDGIARPSRGLFVHHHSAALPDELLYAIGRYGRALVA